MATVHDHVMFSGNFANRRTRDQVRGPDQPFFSGDRVRLVKTQPDSKNSFWNQEGYEFTLNRMWRVGGQLFASDPNSHVFPCSDLVLI